MKRVLSNFGYYLGKYSWNTFIGIIFVSLALFYAFFKVIGTAVAKLLMAFGIISFGADLLMVLLRVFHTFKDWAQIFGATLLVGLGPALAVGLISAILEKITLTIRDNCFID